MEPTRQETRQGKPAEPGALLAAYLHSGKKEDAFVALVDRLGGLVFSSALRRMGSRVLAEEVSQNVFAILARKAGALRSHPNLPAWIYRTTQLECAKAMRSEQRHQRKIAAFASEAARQHESGDAAADPAWQNALPALDNALDALPARDRVLLIARFFEKKRFAEIAHGTGRSEAACKMQLKRALDKLATLLRSRGVALSIPALALGLSAEFARAAPFASPIVASKALAASGSISAATLFSNTILTMSTAKTTAVVAAAVLALGLIPILQLESKAAHLRDDISRLQSSPPLPATHRPGPGPGGQTIRERLASTGKSIELTSLLDDLQRVLMEQDLVGLIRVLTPVANLEPDGFAGLMGELDAYQGNPALKAQASQLLAAFAPDTSYQDSLETMIRQGTDPSGWFDPLRRWAETDPDAALAWFEKARAAGDLLGKGVHADPAPALLAEIAAAFAESILKTGDSRHIDQLLASATEQERSRLVDTAGETIAALTAAEEIADPALRQETRKRIAAEWLNFSPDEARKALPPDLQPRDDH